MLELATFSLEVFLCLSGTICLAALAGHLYSWHKMKPLRDLLKEEETKNKEG